MSELKGCNTEDGEEIKSSQDGGPLDFPFNNTRRRVEYRQEEPKGVGGEEGEKLLFLRKLC